MSRELTPQEIAERSLIKTYRKSIWNPFIAAVKRYELVSPGDKIAVCISGGKDSVMLAKLMQELQRHTDRPFELVFMVMDPGYKPENRKLIEDNAAASSMPRHRSLAATRSHWGTIFPTLWKQRSWAFFTADSCRPCRRSSAAKTSPVWS